MTTLVNEKNVQFNEEGFMTDFSQWDKEVAEMIAAKEGIPVLTPKHWEVINWLQEQHKSKNPLTIRKVGGSGITDIKEFYALFPNGPLKKAAKISGIPKPVSCI
ncbi:MAG TPA: TusE/DsrC/DsvC family sulfur relay protein [Chitinophagales bacterium]|nr:TusE/DsrC/DsvC family sulfur relay protein [Chitinophagales bacterium]HMZ89201.1 TusE/DsrC/DsvC family sulfur relay protein [Chitinophagales bacterium]HNA56775.1 TusE/DsrC/DsvC family sulfur relay protein [Chitinophagales bacterium]HNE46961.1 TusE/DsrC/DsvC family sulfur relay protein [Chitinophagales bacterium]HNF69117.1 TusE/DsrC/DsvC family sulfur relay protein [Chitinophagales bacterium]